MELWKRECTIINAEVDGRTITLQGNKDQSHILAWVRQDSPVSLHDLFKITTGYDLIGKEVKVDLLLKKLYLKSSDGKKDFVRCNFQTI